jgi:hypothetical protein
MSLGTVLVTLGSDFGVTLETDLVIFGSDFGVTFGTDIVLILWGFVVRWFLMYNDNLLLD